MASRAHRLLNLKPNATTAQIKAAFKRAALSAHPDVKGGCQHKFLALQAAHDELLRDQQAEYSFGGPSSSASRGFSYPSSGGPGFSNWNEGFGSSRRAETAEEEAERKEWEKERREWEEMQREARESREELLDDENEHILGVRQKYLRLVLLLFFGGLAVKLAAMKAVSLLKQSGLIKPRPEAYSRAAIKDGSSGKQATQPAEGQSHAEHLASHAPSASR